MSQEKFLDISWGTILKVAVALLSFYVVFLIRDVLLLVLFAVIISLLFNPAIDFLQKRKIPRVLSVALVYLCFFSIWGALFYLILPPFISETQQFSQLFPQYFERIAPPLKGLGFEAFSSFDNFMKGLEGFLVKASSNIFSAVSAIFGGILSAFLIFTIAIFLSVEEKVVNKLISLFSPKKYENYILDIWQKSQIKVSRWFGTKILTSLFVGLVTFGAAKILAVKYAASFGIIAGITNIVPIIGPVVGGAIITIFASLDSLTKSLFLLVIFIILQQVEGNVITPLVTKKLIGIPAVLVLVALLIGGKLLGGLGAFLAIPLAGVIFEVLRDFFKKRKETEAEIV